MLKLALGGCELPYVVACPPVEHICAYWWRFVPCQFDAWRSGTACTECGAAASDAVLSCCNT